MLLWTILTACTEEKIEEPVSGTLAICIPEDLLPYPCDTTPIEPSGTLKEIREGSGNCSVEIVVNAGELDHTVDSLVLMEMERMSPQFLPGKLVNPYL